MKAEASCTATREEIGDMLHIGINRHTLAMINAVHLEIYIAIFELRIEV